MIAVNIDKDGELTRVTTRYNHDFNGENNPGLESPEQLENVLNVPFYQTFKPYTKEELHNMGIFFPDDAQELLDSGKKPEEIFDYVDNFCDGFAVCCLNEDKFNYISTKGQLLSDKWFGSASDFHNGIASVTFNRIYDYYDIDTEGRILDRLTKEPVQISETKTHKYMKKTINESQLRNIVKNTARKVLSEISYNTVTNAKHKSDDIYSLGTDLYLEIGHIESVADILNDLSKEQPDNKKYRDLSEKSMSLYMELRALCDHIQNRDKDIDDEWERRGEELRSSIEDKAGVPHNYHKSGNMDQISDYEDRMDDLYTGRKLTPDEETAYERYM